MKTVGKVYFTGTLENIGPLLENVRICYSIVVLSAGLQGLGFWSRSYDMCARARRCVCVCVVCVVCVCVCVMVSMLPATSPPNPRPVIP